MKKRVLVFLTLALALCLPACKKTAAIKTTESYEPAKTAEFKGKDYITVAESGNMSLLLQPSSGNIRWQDNDTGAYIDTTKAETSLTDKASLSDVVVTYFNGTESQKYNSYASMDAKTFGIDNEKLTFEEMDNGVRFIYHLGSDDITYKNFPAYITEERLNDLVLQYLDKKQVKTIEKQYRLMKDGRYKRNSSADSPLTGLSAKQVYSLFYEVGHYTFEELEYDLTEHNTLDELPANQKIEVVVEYTLDDGDLVVNIPTKHLVTDAEYPIRCIDVLPYFLSTDSKEGYLFVPDSSGALIYLDNDKKSEYQFSARYYHGDVLQNTDTYDATPNYMSLPVYGMKWDDTAVLGIIEKGSEIAELQTYISGYYSGIEYARASMRFYIQEEQTISNYVGSTFKYFLRKVQSDYYTDDITLRYRFLTGDSANYAGMARSYHDYLVDTGTLKESEPEENAPLQLTLLGEIDKEQYFLGIPYKSSASLTTFAEAEKIITEVAGEVDGKVTVKYDGILNKGLNQRAVESVSVSSKLGGTGGLKSLMSAAEKAGASVYPSVYLQKAYTSKNLSRDERSYTLAGSVAVLSRFDLVTRLALKTDEYPAYVISPAYISSYAKKFKNSYDKLGLGRVASEDLFTFFAGDYRNSGNISQTSALPAYMEALSTVADGNSLMLSNPAVMSWGKADYITDVPLSNSNMKILDAWVPFTQLALRGSLPYSCEYVNQDSEALTAALMQAMESGSILNFRLMSSDTSVLSDTTANDIFFAEYDYWKEDIAGCYASYNEYWQKVKDAVVTDHEIIDRNNDLRVVSYDNGLKLYLNYSAEDETIDGVKVPAGSFTLQ